MHVACLCVFYLLIPAALIIYTTKLHVIMRTLVSEFWLLTTVCVAMYASSRISWKSAALIMRYSQKRKWISIFFYCSESPSIAHDLGTTGPIQMGFSAKCTSPNEDINQIENWKYHMCNFWLIPLDHITYVCCTSNCKTPSCTYNVTVQSVTRTVRF